MSATATRLLLHVLVRELPGATANQPSTIASRSGRLVTAFIWISTAG